MSVDYGAALRELLGAGRIIDAPGVLDAASARLAAQVGFDCLYMSGYATSAVLLAKPDFGLLTLTEMTAHLRRIVEAAQKPIIADADTGFGEPVHVRRAVEEYVRAGAAGIHLEDQTYPKRCGYMEGMQVVNPGKMVQRIRAAVDTAAELKSSMIIIARTDAVIVEGLDSAIERGRRYVDAGADVIYIEAPSSREDLAKIAREFDVPLLIDLIEGSMVPGLTRKELQDLGFSIIIRPLSALFLTHRLLGEFYTTLREEGTTQRWVAKMTSLKQFNAFVGLDEYTELEQQYRSE